MRPGVVSLPHGWGHGRPGTRLAVASARPGVSFNDLADETLVDPLCGTARLNDVPVEVTRAGGGRAGVRRARRPVRGGTVQVRAAIRAVTPSRRRSASA